MKRSTSYLDYVRKEREFVRNDIETSLRKYKLRMVEMSITDDGYVIDIVPVESEEIPFKEICDRFDKLKFPNYVLTDIVFSWNNTNIVLVPTTSDAMNRFLWNYVICYFPFTNDTEALAIALGVLERMIEPLGKDVKLTLEKYPSDMIN